MHNQTAHVDTNKKEYTLINNHSMMQDMPMHEMADQNHMMNGHAMHGMYGSYPMTQESSGTSWIPTSSPFPGFYIMRNDWMLMFEGYSYFVYDKQGGCIGGNQFFNENMIMFMAQKDIACNNTFAFRSMFSLEPVTIGACGYPLLFQTGETCDGITPLINRQHPHDLFDELALVGTHRFNDISSIFLYFGLPGEPALGPATFMHRFSGYYNPEAPLSHHWLDSTHITFGVVTAGFIWDRLKLESSIFTGREPDQHRFNFERPHFDSYSVRLTGNPTDNISLQFSYGFLNSPEQLEPNINTRRYTASLMYNKPLPHGNWQTTACCGINENLPGNIVPAFLIESTLAWCKHRIFARFETVDKDELFSDQDPLTDTIFNIKKITTGYVYDWKIPCVKASFGLGGLISGFSIPSVVAQRYGKTFSYMLFMQLRLVEGQEAY